MASVNVLPALLLVVVALFLRSLLARWYDAPPGWVVGAFVLLVAVLLGPSIVGGAVALPLDILTRAPPFEHLALPEETPDQVQYDLMLEVVPWQLTVRSALARGEWPLWEPEVGAGMPVLADAQAQSQAFQPITAPGLLLPLPVAFAAIAALRLLVALVFSFLLLRRLGCGAGPAFFGAVSYGFGGFLVLWLGWPIANSAAALPFLLYAILVTAERGARRDLLLLAVAVFSTLLVGHPETMLYLALAGAALASHLFLRGGRERWKTAVRWTGAALVAAGCAAPALLPLVNHLPRTHRSQLVERRNDRLAREDPLEAWRSLEGSGHELAAMAGRVGQAIAPHAIGSNFRGGLWRGGNLYLYGTGFAGSLALALAVAGLWPGSPRLRLERGVVWVALPILLLVLARPAGLPHLLAAIPGLDRSPSHHARTTLLLSFSLSAMAAMALERWRRGATGRSALLTGAAVTVAAVTAAYLALAPEDPDLSLGLRLRSWGLQVGAVALGVGALAIRHRRARGRALLAGALGAVAFLELVLFFGPGVPSGPRRLYLPEVESVGFLQAHSGSQRVVGLADVLRPNLPSAYGLSDPRISNPSKPWEYASLLAAVSRSRREITDVFVEPVHPLYRLLGVGHVLVRDEVSLDAALPRVFQGDGLRVYEHPEPLPPLFLPEGAHVREGGWLRWMWANPDFGRTSLAAEGPGGADRWRSSRPDASTVTAERLSATRWRGRALLVEPRLLASSVYQEGGWRVLLDGRPVPAVRTNGVFVGAWLPAGDHRLDLVYRPASFVLGALLAGLALAAGIAWLAPPPSTPRPDPSHADEGPRPGSTPTPVAPAP